jgi:hypothetical protein
MVDKPASALKKITAKDVMKGKLDKETAQVVVTNDDGTPVIGADGQPVTREVSQIKSTDVFAVYGEAHSYDTGETQFGAYTVFIGAFEAVRLKDGEKFQSTRVIFPPIADQIAIDTFRRAKQADEMATVDFAFIVGVDPDNRAATGYKFTCKPINAGAETHDPLARLKSSLAPKFAAALSHYAGAREALSLPNPEDAETIQGEAKVIEAPKGGKGAKAAENA